jgi:hypothetical protein
MVIDLNTLRGVVFQIFIPTHLRLIQGLKDGNNRRERRKAGTRLEKATVRLTPRVITTPIEPSFRKVAVWGRYYHSTLDADEDPTWSNRRSKTAIIQPRARRMQYSTSVSLQ